VSILTSSCDIYVASKQLLIRRKVTVWPGGHIRP